MLVMMLGPQPRVKRVGGETVPRGGRSYTQVQPGLAGTSGQNTNTKYTAPALAGTISNFQFHFMKVRTQKVKSNSSHGFPAVLPSTYGHLKRLLQGNLKQTLSLAATALLTKGVLYGLRKGNTFGTKSL